MFCVYLTIYGGDKLPKYYIGSSSINKISNGYVGSVRSKRYSSLWKSELKEHPELFDTVILEECETRELALDCELYWQRRCNVVKSNEFVNMSLAQKDGFFGMSTAGRAHSQETIEKIRDNCPWKGKKRPEHALRLIGQNRPHQSIAMSGENNPMFGKEHPNKGKSLKATYATCPKCGLHSRKSAISRYHGLNGEKCGNKMTPSGRH